jgi:hypothetical protein
VSIVKNGKTAQRKQRYLCKDCRRQFIRDYTNLGRVGAVRDLVVPLTINGAGIRDIERVLVLSTNTILKTLRESAARLEEPAYPRRVHDLEVDEFWSFVGAKWRQRWTWYGYDRHRRKVVAFVNERVASSREEKPVFLDRAAKTWRFSLIPVRKLALVHFIQNAE